MHKTIKQVKTGNWVEVGEEEGVEKTRETKGVVKFKCTKNLGLVQEDKGNLQRIKSKLGAE